MTSSTPNDQNVSSSQPIPQPLPQPLELAPAQAAFEQGNFREVRRLTQALLANAPSPDVATAANSLRARLDIDPWAFRAALIAAVLLAVITGAYVF